mmetsp:Transcript_10737/g.44640  ORF Transcript_10737/g.44640 Transcript_10737/m.44640 type:complete len:309 (-) Transcript_10737:366-1292(-)
MRRAWDGDGAWREDRPPPAPLPTTGDGDPCERLLAAAAAKPRGDDRGHGRGHRSGHRSPLAGEVSRLERTFGAAFAARAVATCEDASLGRTALLRAAMAGDVHGVDACVRAVRAIDPGLGGESPLDVVNVGDRHDVGALTLAAWRGHVDVVDYLLRNGADPNRRDNFGVAALHKAVGHGHLRAALRILGDGGCDVDLRVGDVASAVPTHYRAVSRHQTALHVACYPVPNAKLAAALLRYGADPNLRDDSGNTPLHYACGSCDVAVARLLTRAGADTTVENGDGRTPGDAVPAEGCNEGLMFDVLRGLD